MLIDTVINRGPPINRRLLLLLHLAFARLARLRQLALLFLELALLSLARVLAPPGIRGIELSADLPNVIERFIMSAPIEP
jgi:hypothetical protein